MGHETIANDGKEGVKNVTDELQAAYEMYFVPNDNAVGTPSAAATFKIYSAIDYEAPVTLSSHASA